MGAERIWSARGQYEGRRPFYVGSVRLPVDAKQHEIDAEITALWASAFPFAPPALTAVPGMVVFVPEDKHGR